ncbi:unnamed protein product [Owenia fusiformis]|nr:unnamed protein product [Owenia fusiformis]
MVEFINKIQKQNGWTVLAIFLVLVFVLADCLSPVCKRLACEGNNVTTKLECPENQKIQIKRVKNIAERTCKGVKICESQIQYPNKTKVLCNDCTKCTFQNMISEDGQGERCKTYDEDGNMIWHKTTSQE